MNKFLIIVIVILCLIGLSQNRSKINMFDFNQIEVQKCSLDLFYNKNLICD